MSCRCRKPAQSRHAFNGFSVNLARGHHRYYAMRCNANAPLGVEFLTIPATVKTWQRAGEYAARHWNMPQH